MTRINTLHIVNKPPEHPRSRACHSALKAGDALLLIESGVLALATRDHYGADVRIFALGPDVTARGLTDCAGAATIVDYSEMVELTAQAQHLMSW